MALEESSPKHCPSLAVLGPPRAFASGRSCPKQKKENLDDLCKTIRSRVTLSKGQRKGPQVPALVQAPGDALVVLLCLAQRGGCNPLKNPVRGGRFLNPNAACHQGDGWMLLVRLLKKLACRTDALQWGRSQMPVHGQTTVGMAGKRQASISLSEAMEHLKTKGLHGLTGTPQPGGETLWFPHLFRQGAIDAIVTSNYVHLFC